MRERQRKVKETKKCNNFVRLRIKQIINNQRKNKMENKRCISVILWGCVDLATQRIAEKTLLYWVRRSYSANWIKCKQNVISVVASLAMLFQEFWCTFKTRCFYNFLTFFVWNIRGVYVCVCAMSVLEAGEMTATHSLFLFSFEVE